MATIIKPKAYTVSMQDLVDIWIESFHPDQNIMVIWDAKNHIDLLGSCGLKVNPVKVYDNKILTVAFEDVRGAFYMMDLINTMEGGPYIQIYSDSKLLTDNIDSRN